MLSFIKDIPEFCPAGVNPAGISQFSLLEKNPYGGVDGCVLNPSFL